MLNYLSNPAPAYGCEVGRNRYNLDHLMAFADEDSTRWYMIMLYALVKANRLKTIVELGTYKGVTTGFLASACMGHEGVVYSIDSNQDGMNAFARERLLEKMFFQNVNLIESFSILPLDIKPDLVFVDADHSYDGVNNDWIAWAYKVQYGGFMAFHDVTGCESTRNWMNDKFPVFTWEHFVSPGDEGLLLLRKVA